MPCYHEETPQEQAEAQARRDAKVVARAIDKTFAPLLCSACRALELAGYDFDLNPILDGWWAEHKRQDEERERKERVAATRQCLDDERLAEIEAKPLRDLTDDDKAFLKKKGVTV